MRDKELGGNFFNHLYHPKNIRRMRIAHISQWYIPGLSYQENFLPKEQAKLGHDVWILTSDRIPPNLPPPKDRFSPGGYVDNSVHIRRLRSIMPIKYRGQVYLRGLHAALRTIRPDIIHLHGLWFLPTFQIMARRPSPALVADDHSDNGNLPSGPGNILRFGFARWVCKRHYKKGGKILAVNPFSRWFVTEVLGTPPDGIHFLPLGINTETFFPDIERQKKGRKDLGLLRDECVFITSGRLTPGKGFELLLTTFAGIHAKQRATKLIIIGSGSEAYENQLKSLTEKCKLQKAVIFLPWMSQDNLCTYYNAADIGVLPGKLGGIREILAVNRPLIVPDHLATRYFVERGNGLMFTPGHSSSLARAMSHYSENPELRLQHGAKSLQVARQHLSWTAIARDSLQVYSEAIRSPLQGKRKSG